MPVSDDLLEAAARNDHVAYELINGWSFCAGSQLGGNQVPGMWMLGNAMRLMERARDGVLSTDLLACNRYANGLAAAARGAMPGAGRARRARHHGAAAQREGAGRRAAGRAHGHAAPKPATR